MTGKVQPHPHSGSGPEMRSPEAAGELVALASGMFRGVAEAGALGEERGLDPTSNLELA